MCDRFQMTTGIPTAPIDRAIDVELRILMMTVTTCPYLPPTESEMFVQNRLMQSQTVRAQVCINAGEMGLLLTDYVIHHLNACSSTQHTIFPVLFQVSLKKTMSPPYPWADRVLMEAKALLANIKANTLRINLVDAPLSVAESPRYTISYETQEKTNSAKRCKSTGLFVGSR